MESSPNIFIWVNNQFSLITPFGKIQSVKIMIDKNGQSKQFGFVEFKTPQEATRALLAMNLKLRSRTELEAFACITCKKKI